ncbi:MAG: SagB/ThcOx family dehydrogenase, partial [Syntrophales bacterium]
PSCKNALTQKERLPGLLVKAILSLHGGFGFSVESLAVVDAKEPRMKSLRNKTDAVIQLPEPASDGGISVEAALAKRESVRQFSSLPLAPSVLSQILWAAQGITRDWGGRTAPSAGALYPLELYLASRDGFFHYVPRSHQLVHISDHDFIDDLASVALGQQCIKEAPAVVVIAAVYERIEKKYGRRGERYVKIEAGHAAQNILLQAVSQGIGAVPVGAFYDDDVRKVLSLPSNHEPLYLIPLGHIKK